MLLVWLNCILIDIIFLNLENDFIFCKVFLWVYEISKDWFDKILIMVKVWKKYFFFEIILFGFLCIVVFGFCFLCDLNIVNDFKNSIGIVYWGYIIL